MKHFKHILTPSLLAWIFPVFLIVPNVALAFTEHDPILSKLTDIALPLGVYYLIMSLTVSVGRTVLCCIPLMVFAAFQIVLLYLYGESIIAIDMFLNVATTNIKEVSELLSNLVIAIVTVILIYVPPIVWAIVLLVRKKRCSKRLLWSLRVTGFISAATGILLLTASCIFLPGYSVRRSVFPINVIANMIEAVNRTVDTSRYHASSSAYTYGSELTHDRGLREIYVLVIGETSRADNWQLYGCDRPTNPKLSLRDGLVVFSKPLSESNTTHKSVPMLLSPLSAATFGDSICFTKGICSAFNEAGFNTAFFSNQRPNRSFIDFFAYQAQTTEFIRDNHPGANDIDLIDHLNDFIERSPADKLFVVLHCYGSHFNYRERYDDNSRVFTPDNASEASVLNRRELVNAYDNSIVATDAMLDNIIASLDSLSVPAAVFYTSDHGEDIFDDERGRFLHASPTTTFTQIHVPLIIWLSRAYRETFPAVTGLLESNSGRNVSTSRSLFPTVMSVAGISSPHVSATDDLSSPQYTEKPRLYLNDYNEPVSLRKAGFRNYDIKNAERYNISID